ncbi:MAG TPA: cytochrome c [Pirellulales bacterium]|jgi:mono/diheme cytochrome c family protein|nr:cytochrome c [Pirellulales bacterium]
MSAHGTRRRLVLALGTLVLFAGCQQKMADQPSYKTYTACDYFPDGRSARLLPAGTVARGHLRLDRAYFTGRTEPTTAEAQRAAASNTQAAAEARPLIVAEAEQNLGYVDEFPLPVDKAFVEHGRDRYMIYCVVCHDPAGTGAGKIVERGYTRPPSYHIARLREAPVGRLFAVATHGYGSMPSYAEQIPVRDRWAIVAFIRALQLSRHFPEAELPEPMRRQWETQRNVVMSKSP